MLNKKIGFGCKIIATMFVAQLAISLNLDENKLEVVQAEETCGTIDECDKQINSAQRRISEALAEEESARDQLTEVENDLTLILDSIDETEEAIETLKEDIEIIEDRITDHEAELADLGVQIEDLQDLIAKRMRFTQRMNNNNDLLEFLSESESLIVLIRRIRAINLLSADDAELMEQLNELVERQQAILSILQDQYRILDTNRVALEAEMEALENYKEELENRKAALAKEIEEYENIRLDEEEATQIAEAQKDILDQAVIPEINLNSSRSSNSGDGMFIVPLPSGTVTCEWECYAGHNGIDLSTSFASPILAAAAGTVITSEWHNAYGYYVIITHNFNGQIYSTLYAHLAQMPMVSVGQVVAQGQQIGIMGNTGNSTGPHLHLEVHPGGWRWGGAVNPRQYFDLPAQGRWW